MSENLPRFARQNEILAMEKLRDLGVTIVGVGAIGRQLALQLASMGVGYFRLYDPDTVAEHNLPNQGFPESDLGQLKRESVARSIEAISGAPVDVHGRFTLGQPLTEVVFACVDSMAAREVIYRSWKSENRQLLVDGRMAAMNLEVHTALNDELMALGDWGERLGHYDRTLFPDSEAYQDTCTRQATIFCASVAAAFMAGQLVRFLKPVELEPYIGLNLWSLEMDLESYHQPQE